MNNKNILYEIEEEQSKSDKPLSSEELSRLIKASQDKNFTSIKIKKEIEEGFKKVSLHDIAKQAKTNQIKEKNQEKNKENINTKVDSKDQIKKDNKTQPEQKVFEENIDSKNSEEKSTEREIEENIKPEENIEEKEDEKIEKKEHFEELEKVKKSSFEEGRNKAFEEIKEGSEVAIATLKKISEGLTKIEPEDLELLESQITKKVLEFSSELSGTIIKALPTDFTKRIKSYVYSLENIEGKTKIFINENDFKTLEKNKEVNAEIKNLNIFPNPNLKNGEFEIKINGVSISKKMTVTK